MSAAATARLDMPFVGLRFFEEHQTDIFFGRDDQIHELLEKLRQSRFVAVIGSSGSGKSSLVRAGLFPALRSGLVASAGHRWRIVKTQPREAPMKGLAKALEESFGVKGAELTLRRGPLGLVQAVAEGGLVEGENLLVLVDQFEEIFRYRRDTPNVSEVHDEAAAYVQLLLRASSAGDARIYVLLTMRSDYLGNCSEFRDLPERINDGLYLVPRMQRDHLEEAIRGPLAIFNAPISGALVQRLLNEVGQSMDQLPVLQHALLRMWLHWRNDRGGQGEILAEDCDKTGGLQHGLDQHANEIFEHLTASQKEVVETAFRCLTEKDPRNRDIRRPTELKVIAAIARRTPAEVAAALKPFRAEGTAFLLPIAPVELDPECPLDITHESLIRQWSKLSGSDDLKGWVQDEAEARDQFCDLLKRARRWKTNEDLLSGGDLEGAHLWSRRRLPAEWVVRYEKGDPEALPLVMRYIKASDKAQAERELTAKKKRLYGWGMTIFAIALAALSFVLWQIVKLWDRAEALKETATARQLASQSAGLERSDGSAELRTLLALESLRRHPVQEGFTALASSVPPVVRTVSKVKLEGGLTPDDMVAVSPDRKFMAVMRADKDGEAFQAIEVHETATGRLLASIPALVNSLWWTETGQIYACVQRSRENTTGLDLVEVDMAAKGLRTITTASEAESIGVSHDGFLVAWNLPRGDSRLFDIKKNREIRNPFGSGPINIIGPRLTYALGVDAANRGDKVRLVFPRKPVVALVGDDRPLLSPEGRRFALFNTGERQLTLYDEKFKSDIEVSIPEGFEVGNIRWPASEDDNAEIAVIDSSGLAKVLNESGDVIAILSHENPVKSFEFVGDGSEFLTVDESGELRVSRRMKRPEVTLNTMSRSRPALFHFHPAGKWILETFGGKAAYLDPQTGKHTDVVAVSPDGKYVANRPTGDGIEVRSSDGTLTAAFKPGIGSRSPAPAIALSPEGQFVAVGEREKDGRLRVYSVRSGNEIEIDPEASAAKLRPSFSSDGKYLVAANPQDRVIVLLSTATWKTENKWRYTREVASANLSPTGRYLLIREWGGGVKEMEARSGPVVRLVEVSSGKIRDVGVRGLGLAVASFDSLDRYLAVAQGDHVSITDLSNDREMSIAVNDRVSRLYLNPAGDLLAAGSRTLTVYSVPSRAPVGAVIIPEFESMLTARFVDANTLQVIVRGGGRTALLTRKFRLEDLVSEACFAVSRNPSREEWKRYLPEEEYRRTCENLPEGE